MLAYPEHHSPSSVNCWHNTPIVWCLRYLWNFRDTGPKMWRGTAVEAGFADYLRGADPVQALASANSKFSMEAYEWTDEVKAQAALIEPMLDQAIKWHEKNPQELARTQFPVEVYLDGLMRPFIGYGDFAFMDSFDLDLKTTEACPSKPKSDHLRALAIYGKGRMRPQVLLYVTPKKHAFFELTQDDLDIALREITVAAKSLENFLSIMPDREAAIRSLPTTDHWSFSEAAKAKLAEIGV